MTRPAADDPVDHESATRDAAAGQPVLSVLAAPSAAQVRDELQQLVIGDLLGPQDGPDEQFAHEDPIDRYILGRLAPGGMAIDPAEQDEMLASLPESLEADAEPAAPSAPSFYPSAIGFTAYVPVEVTQLEVSAEWGEYERLVSDRGDLAGKRVWQRVDRGGMVRVPLGEGIIAARTVDPEAADVVVRGRCRVLDGHRLVTLFLENQRPDPRKRSPELWVFQAQLRARGAEGAAVFVPRPEFLLGGDSADQVERRMQAMAHRHRPEFAVGHATAVRPSVVAADPRRATAITTRVVPVSELPFTDVPDATKDPDLPELAEAVWDMQRLAQAAAESGAAIGAVLRPLVVGYRAWIERQANRVDDPAQHLQNYRDVAARALAEARRAAKRIDAGIALLERDDAARRAFAFANRAMHLQRIHGVAARRRRADAELTLPDALAAADVPTNRSWRPFQLAFVLLNLPSLADPLHAERSSDRERAVADLLWFPTGGGKTEAYLGLTAFTIAIRRLQPAHGGLDASRGVAVLMRYTLRLLTIQQFERAAALVCAAEWLRREDVPTWGEAPIRVGLWVGGRVTPNRTDHAAEWVKEQRKESGGRRGQGSPHQLTTCPWCGSKINKGRDLEVLSEPRRTMVCCPSAECPFSLVGGWQLPPDERGLPVLVVDEEIYRHPPALLIATVDKFAQLTWKGETTTLFGRATRRCERHGYVTDDLLSCDWESLSHPAKNGWPRARVVPCDAVRPPDLIIQDELHLIAGPLGSLVGLYETAVDRLASWEPRPGELARPKVIASTATVRRAGHQINALYYRQTQVFPPPGLDAADSFFARQRSSQQQPGRRYVGICAHGVRLKGALIRVYVSVLGAAQALHNKYGANEVTDPYMTLVGYFNSLRDLGGMRRLVEDDVSTRLTRAEHRGLARRYDPILEELTSRMPSDHIRPLLDRLEVTFMDGRRKGGPPPIDVLLATNMIAVGVDVSRLGVMVVANQPKSTAEYIQATSRVGRQAPGLVFTVFNWARPRDLSTYERFDHLHDNLYRHVEALSVTPFADRAIDRGLTGVMVALVRNLDPKYNGNLKASEFNRHGELADHLVQVLKRRANVAGDSAVGYRVEQELESRLDMWDRERSVTARRLAYDQESRGAGGDVAAMLHRPEEGPWRRTTCPTSLREVEPAVQLQLRATVRGDEPPYLPRGAKGTS